MSITSSIITTASVLRGKTNAKANALPVLSEDYNKVVADLNTLNAKLVENRSTTAINVTATATAAQIATGYITSTSAAAVALTLPSAAELEAVLEASTGSSFRFIVDNTAGANTVTVTLPASITVQNTAVITGTTSMAVAAVNQIAAFELIFISATAAKIVRIY